VSEDLLETRDVDGTHEFEIIEASRASSGSRWLHVATQAHELASLLDETVSNQSGDQRRATTYVNVVNARQEVSHRVGRSATRRGLDPSLAIRT